MIILVIDTILIGLLLLTLIIKKYRKYFVAQKIICSLFFLCVSVYFAFLLEFPAAFFFLFPGFLLCFLGDVVLGIYNKKRNKKFFLAGVLFFLLGHMGFIVSAYQEMAFQIWDIIFPAAALLFILQLMKKKEMALGKLKPYCLLYTFFVVMMVTKNVELMISLPSVRTTLLGVGGMLFMVSDYLILYLYFMKKRRWATHGINLVTYYYGVLCMVFSLLY